MKATSDRLTLRGINPTLKRALQLRAEQNKTSVEKVVREILENELELEKERIAQIDLLLSEMK